MNILSAFVIVGIAALLHASFQLSVSMLTLLSSHTIGKKRSQARLALLTNSFVLGAACMTLLLLSFAALVLAPFVGSAPEKLVWTVACGSLMGIGIAVWLFYYRKQAGTTLWVPRGIARFLTTRTKKTTHAAEAFSLGMTSIIGELLFIFAPIAISALVLLELSPVMQLLGILLYAFVSSASLLLVNLFVSNGYSLSRIQKWRESNKQFLQFASGSGLLVLGFYVYVDHVVAVTALAAAGGV